MDFLRRIGRHVNTNGKIISCKNARQAHWLFEKIRKKEIIAPWVYSSKANYIPLTHMFAEPCQVS